MDRPPPPLERSLEKLEALRACSGGQQVTQLRSNVCSGVDCMKRHCRDRGIRCMPAGLEWLSKQARRRCATRVCAHTVHGISERASPWQRRYTPRVEAEYWPFEPPSRAAVQAHGSEARLRGSCTCAAHVHVCFVWHGALSLFVWLHPSCVHIECTRSL